MKYLRAVLGHWQITLSAIVLAAIVHICTTFLLPYVYRGDAYTRLTRNLPPNSFVILPQAQPKAQVIPFQMPDMRYAICSFDLSAGPVSIQALLPEPGWTLGLHAPDGEGFYAYSASDRRTTLNLVVQPPGERFVPHAPEARQQDTEVTQILSPSLRGLAVVRAPLKGRTYLAQAERDLARARCRPFFGAGFCGASAACHRS